MKCPIERRKRTLLSALAVGSHSGRQRIIEARSSGKGCEAEDRDAYSAMILRINGDES
jgi:hypothetical protein